MRRYLLLALLLSLPAPAFAADRAPLQLAAGEAAFWNGPFVENASGGESWTYKLEVTEPGYRLRIGIDHPEVGDVYRVEIVQPGGHRVSFSSGQGLYSAEHIAVKPPIGLWEITVRPESVSETAFRMRAKLEAEPPPLRTKNGPVLPNMQVLPPHEASFLTPLTNGATGGDPAGVDTMGLESCHPEEHVEDRALRCLRFAFGVRNTGLGPLQLHTAGGVMGQDRELIQRVQRANETWFDRPAGTARYHKTHGHYHHHDAVSLRLYRVTDRKKGTLEPASEEHFKGFAHRSELLREWDKFYPTWNEFGFGLEAGWADIYEWDRPGNYIDFALNGDGYYLIRMWADPVKGVLESNERDNVGYTYLKVAGREIELLEAGRGKDPWDPCKIEVGFGGHPDPPREPRPRACPPDTT